MERGGSNFVRAKIDADLAAGTYDGVVTRFPPEPNGYLHIGHAKAILTNFGIAADYGGRCHLRMDDTNPTTEDTEYVEAIKHDLAWLGCDWGEHLYFASDYFDRLYAFAQEFVRQGKAYVCSMSAEELRAARGTPAEPATASPDRDRDPAESLRLLEEMRRGDHPEGAYTLRAKLDLASPNMQLRDPAMYRIRHTPHHRTGDAWHIYPMYDFAHGLSDAIEGVTHSLCSLEFENNRPLYDFYVRSVLPSPWPEQREFARLEIEGTVTSKRKLLQLVRDGHVSGWDDPRMPTLSGFRRRGVRPEAIRAFIDSVGLAKANSTVDPALLDHFIRDDLNTLAPRRMGVLDPLEVVVENWEADEVDWLDAPDWPHDVPKEGSRRVPFSKVLVIDQDDFAVDPPTGWRRLAPGAEVRLRHGYVFQCTTIDTDGDGTVLRLRGLVDRSTRGGTHPEGRKVKGAIHWVSKAHAVTAEVRLYDRLFAVPNPGADGDFLDDLDPASLQVVTALVEPAMADASGHVQLERVATSSRRRQHARRPGLEPGGRAEGPLHREGGNAGRGRRGPHRAGAQPRGGPRRRARRRPGARRALECLERRRGRGGGGRCHLARPRSHRARAQRRDRPLRRPHPPAGPRGADRRSGLRGPHGRRPWCR